MVATKNRFHSDNSPNSRRVDRFEVPCSQKCEVNTVADGVGTGLSPVAASNNSDGGHGLVIIQWSN